MKGSTILLFLKSVNLGSILLSSCLQDLWAQSNSQRRLGRRTISWRQHSNRAAQFDTSIRLSKLQLAYQFLNSSFSVPSSSVLKESLFSRLVYDLRLISFPRMLAHSYKILCHRLKNIQRAQSFGRFQSDIWWLCHGTNSIWNESFRCTNWPLSKMASRV